MSDSDFDSHDEVPQFGAVDIVEAFTAMRHEWRGQAKETRMVADQIQAVVRQLDALDAGKLSRNTEVLADTPKEGKQFARLVGNIDHQLTRALHAIDQADRNRVACEKADLDAITEFFSRMNGLARWLARPLFAFCIERNSKNSAKGNPSLEGLALVLSSLRQAMQEQGIERIDVLGQPFEGTMMNAIGVIESSDYPPGCVAEQIAPCYRWKDSILRFADVRIAQIPPKQTESV